MNYYPVLEDFKGTVRISHTDPYVKSFDGPKKEEKRGCVWMEFTRGDQIPSKVAKSFPTLKSLQRAGFIGEEVIDDDASAS